MAEHALGNYSEEERSDRQYEARRKKTRRVSAHKQMVRDNITHLVQSVTRSVNRVLVDHGVTRTDTDTAVFTRSLAAVLQRAFDRRFPALKARMLMPPPPPLDPGAESVLARGHEPFGEATIGTSYDTEPALVDLQGGEDATVILNARAAWLIHWQQQRAGAMSGVALNEKGLVAARQIVERAVDEVLSIGYTNAAGTTIINGLVHPPGVTARQGGVWGGTTGTWTTATAAQILADLAAMNTLLEAQDLYIATDLVLAPAEWNTFITLPVGIVANMTVMEWVKMAYGWNITKWNRLTTIPAGFAAGGVAVNRALLYENTPDIVEPLIPVDTEALPTSWDGERWRTVFHSRFGGVHCENPNGFVPFDMS